jgi:hypothetical protein
VSRVYIRAKLRLEVVLRAGEICEYCLVHRDDACFGHAVDHVISAKHGGRTDMDNLALSCASCNQRKGTDIGSIVPRSGRFVGLFNPRRDVWNQHFRLSDDALIIHPRSDVGRVTVRLLGLNDFERQVERAQLREDGRYPPRAALRLIQGFSRT